MLLFTNIEASIGGGVGKEDSGLCGKDEVGGDNVLTLLTGESRNCILCGEHAAGVVEIPSKESCVRLADSLSMMAAG